MNAFFLVILFFVPFYFLSFILGDVVLLSLCVIISFLAFFLVFLWGDRILLFLLDAKEAQGRDYRPLMEKVDFYSFKFNIRRPGLFLVEKDLLGLFPLGTPWRNGLLINKNLLGNLNAEEWEALLAYSMMGLKKGDVLLKIVAALWGSFLFRGSNLLVQGMDFFLKGLFFLKKERKKDWPFLFATLLFIFFIHPICELIVKLTVLDKNQQTHFAEVVKVLGDDVNLVSAFNKISQLNGNQKNISIGRYLERIVPLQEGTKELAREII